MAKQTKEQKAEYVKTFFEDKENASVKALFLNPRGEWFTDESYANNSLPKNDKGDRVGKLEVFERDTTDTGSPE
ncbi:MAG: hypothetical protein WCJ72_06520 [Chryseobacterium sp.]